MASWIGTGGSNPGNVKTEGNIETHKTSYPTFQVLNYGHDNVGLILDAYYSGGWKSADAGSNFRIYKIGDALRIGYASGVGAGSTISAWGDEDDNCGIVLDKNGNVAIGHHDPAEKLDVKGDVKISQGCITLAPRAPAAAPAYSIYVNSVSGKLCFKDGSGNSHNLY
jgi:hypothetical protein